MQSRFYFRDNFSDQEEVQTVIDEDPHRNAETTLDEEPRGYHVDEINATSIIDKRLGYVQKRRQPLAGIMQKNSGQPTPSSNYSKVFLIILFGSLMLYLTDRFEWLGDRKIYLLNSLDDLIPGDTVIKQAKNFTSDAEETIPTLVAESTTLAPTAAIKNTIIPKPTIQTPTALQQTTEAPAQATVSPTVATSSPTVQATANASSAPPANIDVSNIVEKRKTYKTRGQPLSPEERKEIIDKWGSWSFNESRPQVKDSFYQSFPNRDVPHDQWPENAWQRNPEYLKQFLGHAMALVERTQNAIFQEYTFTNNDPRAIFSLKIFEEDAEILDHTFPGRGQYGGSGGGWTTRNTWAGLKRRLLHAIITEDSFVVAMAGHSAAAGHGNLFQQSYTLQIQWILEGVFARLGVKHEARNFGMGGLGTSQNGMAASSIYGHDIDFLHWDSGMTERETHLVDMLARQIILGGSKVPILWNMYPEVSLDLLRHANVEIGAVGTGFDGITKATLVEEIQDMPWAMQYVNCDSSIHDICRTNEYIGHCWIDREDYTPEKEQKSEPGGRASWHPGNRKHQVTGRILTMTILQALKDVLTEWQQIPNYLVEDSAWHITPLYASLKTKVSSLNPDQGSCFAGMQDKHKLEFLCSTAMKGRTEFTPRHNPALNIRSLMPHADLVTLPNHYKNSYEAPDAFNPDLHPPKGAIDVLNIVEAGLAYESVLDPDYISNFFQTPKLTSSSTNTEPGLGITLDTVSGNEFCDGTVDSFCNKGTANDCLLYSHNDGRNGLLFDGYSGWLLFNLPKVEEGYIVIRIQSWHGPQEGSPNVWKSINGKRRDLKQKEIPYCVDFVFEYMINGKITSVSLTELKPMMEEGHIQRVVETLTLLQNPDIAFGDEEVEVGIRIRGCGHDKVWALTHVYWS